ncbi:MAG TPA: hypothetical protein VF189_04990 [Patescibacteria group bacterium]
MSANGVVIGIFVMFAIMVFISSVQPKDSTQNQTLQITPTQSISLSPTVMPTQGASLNPSPTSTVFHNSIYRLRGEGGEDE